MNAMSEMFAIAFTVLLSPLKLRKENLLFDWRNLNAGQSQLRNSETSAMYSDLLGQF